MAVRVGTGEGQQSWTIQKKLLTFHSTFFAAALNGEFNEAITHTVELDEDDTQAFQLFVLWLYNGRFVVYSLRDTDQDILSDYSGSVPDFLCVVWANCPGFQDHALLQLMVLYHKAYFQPDVLVDAYKLSPPGSKLRQFVVDKFLFQIEWGSSEEEGEGLFTPGCWNFDRLGLGDFNRDALTWIVETRGRRFRPTFEDGGRYLLLLDWEVHSALYFEA